MPADLTQQRFFRKSYFTDKRARASNARPYKSFFDSLKYTSSSRPRWCTKLLLFRKTAIKNTPQLLARYLFGDPCVHLPRTKKQSAGLFFAACGRPSCSIPRTEAPKKLPSLSWGAFFGEPNPNKNEPRSRSFVRYFFRVKISLCYCLRRFRYRGRRFFRFSGPEGGARRRQHSQAFRRN